MQTLTVDLLGRAYPIWVVPSLSDHLSCLDSVVAGSQVMIVSTEPVAELYLSPVQEYMVSTGRQVDTFLIPDGEFSKTLETVESIIEALILQGHDRGTTVLALGGGVTGDIVGFAAAVFQRGVDFIQIPTTLLAQVDSSVGGKTGVNHALGKNMIGAFYQPNAVLMGLDVLHSLPKRQYCAGLAEIVKYGLIYDATFFDWLEQHAGQLVSHDETVLEKAILRSCEIKSEIVAQDERESGVRAILNYGHTFGHALEVGLGYVHLLHGEAVSIGMVMATDLSEQLGHLPKGFTDRLIRFLRQLSLPVGFPRSLAVSDIKDLMKRDKKVQSQKIRLVLLKCCGKAFVTADFDRGLLDLVIGNRQNNPSL